MRITPLVLCAAAAGAALPRRAPAQTPAPGPVGPPAPGRPGPGPALLRLSFSDAVRRAAGEAPAVELAGLRTDSAEARVREARAAVLPFLSVDGLWVNRTFNTDALGIPFPPQFGVPNPVPAFDTYDGRVTVTENLLDVSSLARVKLARAGADLTRAVRGTTVEAAADVAAMAYLRAARAAATVAARQADSSIAVELVALAEAQRANGVSAAIDVTRARTELVQAEGRLVLARNAWDRARIALARALGLDPATPIALADTLSAALGAADLPRDRDAAIAAALENRPDLQVEAARARAAERAGQAIRAERLPRLGLEADYGFNGLTPASALATRQVAVKVTVPVLDGFGREARLTEQRAEVQASAVRARDLRQQIAADVDTALLDIGSAAAQQAIAAEQLSLAQEELAQARERFRAGVAGNIEVINAQASLVRARDADIAARFAAAAARVALAGAVGLAHTLH